MDRTNKDSTAAGVSEPTERERPLPPTSTYSPLPLLSSHSLSILATAFLLSLPLDVYRQPCLALLNGHTSKEATPSLSSYAVPITPPKTISHH